MTQLLANLDLKEVTASILVVVIVIMILTDQIVTKARLREANRTAEYWRAAYFNEVGHVNELIRHGLIGTDAVASIAREAAKRGGPSVEASD